jgi:hypothetical protein
MGGRLISANEWYTSSDAWSLGGLASSMGDLA